MDAETSSKIQEIEKRLQEAKNSLQEASASLRDNQSRILALESLVKSPRVRFDNFEGCFKTFSTVPTNAADFKNGTVFLSDVATVRKIHAVINGAIYSATLT